MEYTVTIQTIENWNEIDPGQHVFFKQAAEIDRLIYPLALHFGLNSFNYHKTYHNDAKIYLSNDPKWQAYYLQRRLYLHSVFELSAHNYVKTRIIWSNVDDHGFILHEALKFGINYGVTLVEPVADGCEFYFLGTTTKDKNVMNKYLSNFALVEKFIANFRQGAQDMFARVEPHQLIIRDWQNNDLHFNSTNQVDRLAFLMAIYGYTFSRRELDCVPLLLKGYSCKQIAEHLKISFRTVEVYVNNLKQKTGTGSKNELLYLLAEKFA